MLFRTVLVAKLKFGNAEIEMGKIIARIIFNCFLVMLGRLIKIILSIVETAEV